jgi:transposase
MEAIAMRRRGPDPVRVTVTKRQRAALEALVNDEDARPRLRQRARIVLGAADGDSNREVAASVGVSEPTVSTWRARFAEGGLAALEDRPHGPRPGRRAGRPLAPVELTVEQRDVLERWCRRPSTAAGLARRSRIVLLAAEALGNDEVAERVGCHPATVTKWRQRFLAHGLVGSPTSTGPGGPAPCLTQLSKRC